MPEDTETTAPVSPERKRVEETQKAADVAAERASRLRFEAARDLRNAERQREHAAKLRKESLEVDGGGGDAKTWREAEKSEQYAKRLEKDAAERQAEAVEAQAAADELQVEADEAAKAVGAANPEHPSVSTEPGEDEVGDLGDDDDEAISFPDEPTGAAGGDEGFTVPDDGSDSDVDDAGVPSPDAETDFGFETPDEPVTPAYEPDVMEPDLQIDEPAPTEEPGSDS
jgi:hypothetical protein